MPGIKLGVYLRKACVLHPENISQTGLFYYKEMEFYSLTSSPGMVFITVHLQIYILVKFLFHFWIVPFYITKIKLNPILTLKKGG